MDGPNFKIERFFFDGWSVWPLCNPDHCSNDASGLGLNGRTVQLAATAGGRGASSASRSSTMSTAVDTFANALTPDTVKNNEQCDVILPADFFWEKFRKTRHKSAAKVELDFFTRTYNYFPFLKKIIARQNVWATLVPAELQHSMIGNNIDKWKRFHNNTLNSEEFMVEAKYAYSLEVSKRACLAWKYLPRERETPVCSTQHAFTLLFYREMGCTKRGNYIHDLAVIGFISGFFKWPPAFKVLSRIL